MQLIRLVLLFCFWLFSFSSSAQALLSHEQWLQLPESHQKEYLGDLQKLVVELSTQEAFLSQNKNRFEKYFSILVATALGSEQLNKICELKSAGHLSNPDLFSKIAQTRNCTEVIEKGKRTVFVSSVPKRVEILSAEFNARILSGAITAQTKHYDAARGDLLNLQNELLSRGSLSRGSPTSKSISPSPVSQTAPATLVHRQHVVPVVAPSSQSYSAETPHCLYAGFLIPKNSAGKCLPFKQLPDSLVGTFFSSSEFVCVSQEQIICNPVLFGFDHVCDGSQNNNCQKKPVCVWKSQDATKNCFEASQSKKSLSNIIAFLRSHEGSKAYQEFTQGLELLCNEQNLKARHLRESVYTDIKKTCEVSFAVISHNTKNKYLPELAKSRVSGQPAKSSK